MLKYILVCAMFFSSFQVLGESKKYSEESLTLLNLNTWMIPFLRKKATTRSKLIGRYSQSFDFVMLQEIFNRKQRKIITREINKGAKFDNRYQRTPFLKINSGVFNLSKFKIVKSSFKRFTRCSKAQCLSGKGVLHTRVQLPSGIEIDLYNTHLQPFSSGKEIRKSQIKEIMIHIDKTNDGKRAAILVGDFNISGGSNEYDSIIKILENYDFEDVWTTLNYDQPGYTWDSNINVWSKKMDGNYTSQHRFDYIFVKSGTEDKVELLKSQIVFDEALSLEPGAKKYFLSDHFGVSLEFRIIKNN